MKILNVVSHALFPVSDGGRAHSFSNIVSLSNENKVVILSPDTSIPDKYHPFDISLTDHKMPSSKSKFTSLSLLKQLKSMSKNVDTVIIDYPWFALHCLLLNITYEIREHNVEYLRFKSYKKWFWPILYLYENVAYKFASKVHCITSQDRQTLIDTFNLDPKKCVMAPYCPDPTRFYPTEEFTQNVRQSIGLQQHEMFILFFGKLDYTPNVEALNIIKTELLPKLSQQIGGNFKVVICGKNGTEIKHDHVVNVGYVEHIEHFVQSCDIMINPIISGGGVKTKVLETLACNKKVISSEQGAIGVQEDKNLHTANNWQQFVQKIIEIHNEQEAKNDE